MPRLEFETYDKKTERWSKAGSLETDKPQTLLNFRPKDGKQEMILLECGDADSTIKTAELGEKSFVRPNRMQVLHPEGPLVEIIKLREGESFEMTIQEYESSPPIEYRFTHK